MEMAVRSDNGTGLPRASMPCCRKPLSHPCVTPLRWGGESKTLPRQQGRAAAAGLQISQSREKSALRWVFFFSRERNWDWPHPTQGGSVIFFGLSRGGKRKVWEERGRAGQSPWGSSCRVAAKAAAQVGPATYPGWRWGQIKAIKLRR